MAIILERNDCKLRSNSVISALLVTFHVLFQVPISKTNLKETLMRPFLQVDVFSFRLWWKNPSHAFCKPALYCNRFFSFCEARATMVKAFEVVVFWNNPSFERLYNFLKVFLIFQKTEKYHTIQFSQICFNRKMKILQKNERKNPKHPIWKNTYQMEDFL